MDIVSSSFYLRFARGLVALLRLVSTYSRVDSGIEGVVFVGGVSLGQPATSIPIAAIVGLVCGVSCGFIIYQFASRASKGIIFISPGLF